MTVSQRSFSFSHMISLSLGLKSKIDKTCSNKLPKKIENTFSIGYYPELDVSTVLRTNEAHHQSLIGVISWMVMIGCIDINTKVSLLSLLSYVKKGHLEAALLGMSYLKLKHD